MEDLRVAIVGASIGGLSAANVLCRLGVKHVQVFEVFKHGFQDRGGALGSIDLDLLLSVRRANIADHPELARHSHYYGDLWRYLFEGLPEGTVRFGADVTGVEDADGKSPTLVVQTSAEGTRTTTQRLQFDLIIGADGGKSTIRRFVTSDQPQYAGYTLWRGLVATKHAPEGMWGGGSGRGMAASATIRGNYYETGGYAVTIRGQTHWNVGVYMPMPEEEVARPTRNRQVGAETGLSPPSSRPSSRPSSSQRPSPSSSSRAPPWFVPFATQAFGAQCGAFWAACVARGKLSPHPVWELAASRVVRKSGGGSESGGGGRVLLLGDAAHMATPRTGAGAQSAMADALALGAVLRRACVVAAGGAAGGGAGGPECAGVGLDDALAMYNDNVVSRGKQLWQACRRIAVKHAPAHGSAVSPAALLHDA